MADKDKKGPDNIKDILNDLEKPIPDLEEWDRGKVAGVLKNCDAILENAVKANRIGKKIIDELKNDEIK